MRIILYTILILACSDFIMRHIFSYNGCHGNTLMAFIQQYIAYMVHKITLLISRLYIPGRKS
jgi:hypothetical protein